MRNLLLLAHLALPVVALASTGRTATDDEAKAAPVVRSGPATGATGVARTLTGKVTDVDVETRQITVETPGGEVLTMTLGPTVKRTDLAAPGETLTVTYEQGRMLDFRPEEALPAGRSGLATGTTTRHAVVPEASTATQVWTAARVIELDPKRRVLTLQDEHGKNVQLEAGPDVDPSELEPGQRFLAHYTEPVVVSLAKARTRTAAAHPR